MFSIITRLGTTKVSDYRKMVEAVVAHLDDVGVYLGITNHVLVRFRKIVRVMGKSSKYIKRKERVDKSDLRV